MSVGAVTVKLPTFSFQQTQPLIEIQEPMYSDLHHSV